MTVFFLLLFTIKIQIGQNLAEPRLTENKTLDALTIHRLFSQKIVWLVATRDMLVRATLFSVFETVYCVI